MVFFLFALYFAGSPPPPVTLLQFLWWKSLLKQQRTNNWKSKVILFFYHISAMQFLCIQHFGHRVRLINDLFWPEICEYNLVKILCKMLKPFQIKFEDFNKFYILCHM